MYENGFHLISDLLDEDGNFMKLDDFKHKIYKLPFTLYEGLKKARSWPDARHTAADQVLQPYQSSVIKILTRGRDLIHVLGHDHVSHYCEYALSSTLSIFSKLIAIV